MEFKELENLLKNGKYHLLSAHLQNFCLRLQCIYSNGVGAMTDCIMSMRKIIMVPDAAHRSVISKTSVLGIFISRIMLYLDRLTFVQLSSLYKSFCLYYQKGRPGLICRTLSKEKLNSMEQSQQTPTSPEENKPEQCLRLATVIDKDNNFGEHQWSLKQAELYIAQQANLLQLNEQKALPPNILQKIIKQIVNDLPEYPDVHFLSFLNCLRVKEFCGAQDSLYNCFDRSIFAGQNNTLSLCLSNCDRNKNFRFAALNRAAMHAHFGHNEVALESVSEALVMAQEAGDSACLSHVVGWAARAGGRGRRAAILARTPRSPRAASAAATAAQLLAQHMAVNGAQPSDVFSLITKGDAINYMHSMSDLMMASLANTAALWALYGKTEMASINCQLLLNLNTKSSNGVHAEGSSEATWQWSAASGAAAAGTAAAAMWRGEVVAGSLVLSAHPAAVVAGASHQAHATLALHARKWEEADQSIKQLASFDRWESQFLRAEMYFLKGEPTESLETLKDILDYCKTEDDSLHYMSLKLRSMILMSQVKHAFCGMNSRNSTNLILLNEVVSTGKKYNLHYLSATAEMHIANVQLHMGCVHNALSIVKRALPTIMAHGGAYDMARAMLLYSKCRVATAPQNSATGSGGAGNETRQHILQSCCEALEAVKSNFAKIEAYSRLLEIWYLQAQLYNEIGNYAARNHCAFMYRQLEAQNNVEPTNLFVISY